MFKAVTFSCIFNTTPFSVFFKIKLFSFKEHQELTKYLTIKIKKSNFQVFEKLLIVYKLSN